MKHPSAEYKTPECKPSLICLKTSMGLKFGLLRYGFYKVVTINNSQSFIDTLHILTHHEIKSLLEHREFSLIFLKNRNKNPYIY